MGGNAHSFSPDNLSQGLRLHQGHQQQQPQTQQHQNGSAQQKQHNVTSISGVSTTSNLVGVTVPSIAQTAQNSHRNLQQTASGHQKPVSSVAPSFSVKSQIYQTSSTKIHPVMPQTLSLLGRGHNNNTAPNYIGNNQQQAATTQLVQASIGNQETMNYRHGGYSAVQQQQQQQYSNQTTNIHASSPAAVYQVQSSSNLHGTIAATSFGNSTQKYSNQSQLLNSNDLAQNQDQNQIPNNQKAKFEPSGKNQDKFEHALSSGNKHEQQQQARYDQNLTGKYESQQQSNKHDSTVNQAKHEQHLHNIKYEPSCQNSQQYGKHEQQQQHEGRLPAKYDHNPTFKHDTSNIAQYKTEYKSESNKYESSQNKFEVPAKYEQNSTTKHVVDHVAVKFEMPVKTTERPFEFDSRPTTKSSDNSERKTFNELRMEDKTKPALPPKPSKPNPPPRLTHHEKIDVPSSEGISECKMVNTNLNSRFIYTSNFKLKFQT